VILDLEAASPRTFAPRFGLVLSLASASVAAAAILFLNALPHERVIRALPSIGPSVITQALARPRPATLALELPSDLAVPISPLRVDGVYGPPRPEPTVRSYRIRGSNDTVVIALASNVPPVRAPSPRPADSLSVHGSYAVSWTVEANSVSVVRWTEKGSTYEVSSRTLRPADLARIAEQVR
jgi:hypothetical protein